MAVTAVAMGSAGSVAMEEPAMVEELEVLAATFGEEPATNPLHHQREDQAALHRAQMIALLRSPVHCQGATTRQAYLEPPPCEPTASMPVAPASVLQQLHVYCPLERRKCVLEVHVQASYNQSISFLQALLKHAITALRNLAELLRDGF